MAIVSIYGLRSLVHTIVTVLMDIGVDEMSYGENEIDPMDVFSFRCLQRSQ